jgi:hypothetical protein
MLYQEKSGNTALQPEFFLSSHRPKNGARSTYLMVFNQFSLMTVVTPRILASTIKSKAAKPQLQMVEI